VATWFTQRFKNPGRPLASVALLVSEPGGDPAAAATIDNVVRAIEQWFERCDSDKDNLPVLYFCGHGLASGALLSLLTESFGGNPHNALDGAIDFNRLHGGMARCAARQQLFLIDACRTDARMTRYADGYAGRVILQPTGNAWSERPVFYSTLKGLQAFGRDERSHFAEALIAAFEGTASDDAEGDWRVNTDLLHRALSLHMQRKIEAGLASAQIPPADNLSTFDLHFLDQRPRVPVFVSCQPAAAIARGKLHYAVTGTTPLTEAPRAEKEVWELELEAGRYDFEARFDPPFKTAAKQDFTVIPPYRKVPLGVVS
jgi:hypothetical protein